MTKQYFYLTNEGLIAFDYVSGQLKNRQEFMLANDGLQNFAEHLAASPHVQKPAYLFIDLYDEDFRLDTIPHLSGNDAKAVVNRRLSQIFRTTPYRNSINQGRESDGRRDDKMLYHAINNVDTLDPWLAILTDAMVPLTQISSTAVGSQLVLKELGLSAANAAPHILLLTFVPNIGLRQTYFRDQSLKFSRLTPLPLDQPALLATEIGTLVDAETDRTWQYLDSLRFFNADSVLEVCVIANATDKAQLEAAFAPTSAITHRVFDIADVAAKLKLDVSANTKNAAGIYSHASAEEVLLALFAKQGVANHFATPSLRAHARSRTARNALLMATLGFLAIGTAVAGGLFYEGYKIAGQTQAQTSETDNLITQYKLAASQNRNQVTPPDTVRDTASFYTSQIAPVATPTALVVEVAEVLSQMPEISLAQIVWQVVADPQASLNFSPLVANLSDVKSVGADVAKAAAASVPAATALGGSTATPLTAHKAQAAIFEATLTRFDGDYRRANAVVAALVDALNARGVVRVKVHSQPLDTVVSTTISGKGVLQELQADVEKNVQGLADVRFEIRVDLVQKAAASMPAASAGDKP